MRETAISKKQCHNCGNKGHISEVCRIKGKHKVKVSLFVT